MKNTLTLLSIVCSCALTTQPVEACSLATNYELSIDPAEQAMDSTPPMAGKIVAASIGYSNACDIDSNLLSVTIAHGNDNRTPQNELGYVVEVASGSLPPGFTFDGKPSQPFSGANPTLVYFGKTSASTVDLELRLITVDAAGNRSAPSASFRVDAMIDHGRGCTVAAGARRGTSEGGLFTFALLGLATLAGLRKRRTA